ncbi:MULTISPECIES: DNA polymerase III subunit delta [unclassified Lactococcus]|uniref:DNA polymerase III subunit delta n=1 Tax=unclassified Lactococcus TaxID=2643510 RepID=UPI0011CB26DF|nr:MULTISPECIES: DNA polymerase III subunit delta [unclassified Lactococcus]MQW22517.1 DNA polymerase III subunit delta [Lactococcus sp. dk101]TXK45541.1 DNA polymerase III subunit delta [Lactococcus sp. dk310]TXK51392.1 DNA polymerase III subunit delta [Lactococcus sp. dk322]
MTVFEQLEQMKANGFPKFVVVSGEDEAIIQEIKAQFLESVHYDPTDLSQSYFDLTANNADLALEELESLPFFSDSKLVIFENLSNLTTEKKSVFDDKQIKRFENYIDHPAEFTQLFLILHGKLDSRLKIVKKLKKMADFLEASKVKRNEILQYLLKNNPTLKAPVLNLILDKSNEQFAIVKQNIALLQAYAPDREITRDDVEKVVPKSLQDNIFLLTELVIRGKIEEARNLVHDLTLQGEEIIKLTAILTNSYRLYYQTKIMQQKKWPETKQTEQLKINPYRIKLANQLVRSLPASYFSEALLELIDLDFQLKRSSADKNYLFDLTLIKLTLKNR